MILVELWKEIVVLKKISAWFQLEYWSASARLDSARKFHSLGSLEPENSSSNSSLASTVQSRFSDIKSCDNLWFSDHLATSIFSIYYINIVTREKKEKKWKDFFLKNEKWGRSRPPQLNLTAVCYIATFSLLLFVVWTLAWPQ